VKLWDVVVLIEDMPELNLHKGQVGTVVEVYEPDEFEVEFADLHRLPIVLTGTAKA
jgi:hypothetical protein